jgi:hypothetical protein
MSKKLDERLCRRMHGRYKELAGMLKEKGEGTYNEFHQIISKFAVQEGLKRVTAQEYAETLVDFDLILMKEGSGEWRYNEEAEWDMFKINIGR